MNSIRRFNKLKNISSFIVGNNHKTIMKENSILFNNINNQYIMRNYPQKYYFSSS
jgi:hypothetical protein